MLTSHLKSSLALVALASCVMATPAPGDLAPLSGYEIKYQLNNMYLAGIDVAAGGQMIGGSFSYTPAFDSLLNLQQVTLSPEPVFFTQSPLPTGSTYANGYVSTDGTQTLTGLTGWPGAGGLFPGRIYLTRNSDGVSSSLDVPGNFDATQSGGTFYLSAGAGTPSGLGDDGYSGVYLVRTLAGTLPGLNLVLDTGAPSGFMAADGGGNLVFSLGGNSIRLSGTTNSLYRLSAGQVATGVAAGTTTGLDAAAPDLLIAGADLAAAANAFVTTHTPPGESLTFFGLSDMVVRPDGDLIVGVSGFYSDFSSVGMGLLLTVSETGGDYSAVFDTVVYTNTTDAAGYLAYRADDDVLWASADGNLYGLEHTPEPATLALLAVGGACWIGRRRFSRKRR